MFRKLFNNLEKEILILFEQYRNEIDRLKIEEKEDKSLLTEADLNIQNRIVNTIRLFDNSPIVAEELELNEVSNSVRDFWIIDPIDGTREFINPNSKEFCSVVCFVRDRIPQASLLIAPEIEKDPIIFKYFLDKKEILLNNKPIADNLLNDFSSVKHISATGSKDELRKVFKEKAESKGAFVKTQGTSQSLDLLKLFIQVDKARYDLFYRRDQKLWDGIIGFSLARYFDFDIVDLKGNGLTPLEQADLDIYPPINKEVLIGKRENIDWFFENVL